MDGLIGGIWLSPKQWSKNLRLFERNRISTSKDFMQISSSLLTLSVATLIAATAQAASTGLPFYGDAPDATHPWCVHDWNRPQPPRVEPKPLVEAKAPTDAIILFDGTEATLANWEADKPQSEPTQWVVKDGALLCVPKSGYVRTKSKFGDCQLHVEWSAPTPPQGESQGRGNSGIFLEGIVECQVLDNYDNPTYADGFACSIYSVCPPLANALRPPGQWQQIDITFRRPVYEGEKLVHPGYATVYCNGILVQDKTQLEGGTSHMGRAHPSPMPEAGPLKLQDHGNPVRYRNIWYRPLPPRVAADDKGIHGPMSEQATAAKRKEIATMVRAAAAKLPADSLDRSLRLAESLVYEKDEAIAKSVIALAAKTAADVKQLPADKIESKKDDTTRVWNALNYLAKFKIIDSSEAALTELDSVVKSHGWDKH